MAPIVILSYLVLATAFYLWMLRSAVTHEELDATHARYRLQVVKGGREAADGSARKAA